MADQVAAAKSGRWLRSVWATGGEMLAMAAAAAPAWAETPVQEADRLAAATVAKLTTAEKIDQLMNVAPAIPRLGISAYNWWTESLHGALGPVPTTN